MSPIASSLFSPPSLPFISVALQPDLFSLLLDPDAPEVSLELADAVVWVKPGGEFDGTNDSSTVRYGSFCGKLDAYKTSSEAGCWNQACLEMLPKNAEPSS
ncbi:exoglucanase 3 [Colletotrichum graminicola M1.001]|uniref:Exoglucanase 3 n=1 Tax=Colletotrichum graminicola (strain M1.001 / M2 / FGSC 10212) TaxID=645133 RepID=E3QT67_COLGM|nr:exoglucanase 3 [Colletotrichum graminicola M1.001]EFQ34055.1 exoglucanase 3 [Colletotrichum graminicola M1.001]